MVETQQVPDIGKVDSKSEISCLKWTIYNGKRKVCINFQTDADKVNIVVYHIETTRISKILNWI